MARSLSRSARRSRLPPARRTLAFDRRPAPRPWSGRRRSSPRSRSSGAAWSRGGRRSTLRPCSRSAARAPDPRSTWRASARTAGFGSRCCASQMRRCISPAAGRASPVGGVISVRCRTSPCSTSATFRSSTGAPCPGRWSRTLVCRSKTRASSSAACSRTRATQHPHQRDGSRSTGRRPTRRADSSRAACRPRSGASRSPGWACSEPRTGASTRPRAARTTSTSRSGSPRRSRAACSSTVRPRKACR
jgi:hypothetical protein